MNNKFYKSLRSDDINDMILHTYGDNDTIIKTIQHWSPINGFYIQSKYFFNQSWINIFNEICELSDGRYNEHADDSSFVYNLIVGRLTDYDTSYILYKLYCQLLKIVFNRSVRIKLQFHVNETKIPIESYNLCTTCKTHTKHYNIPFVVVDLKHNNDDNFYDMTRYYICICSRCFNVEQHKKYSSFTMKEDIARGKLNLCDANTDNADDDNELL